MTNLIQNYISSIQSEFDTQQSTEHSFRTALKVLLESLNPSILALNESQRITWVGMPDFTIKDKKDSTINAWWIEAKDLYVDLDEKKNTDQLWRYLAAFDNFIYTNNLTFNFYRQGKKVESVSLGTCDKKTITRQTSDLFADSIQKLERLLKDFLNYQGQTITSPEKLARAMAQKAQLIKYAIETIFAEDNEKSWLYTQYLSFKDLLVHDLTPWQFADMYAQTIAYGLFSARLHDPTLPTFSREEAERLIPKSTPFIRWLFKQMSNDDEFDDRIAYIIDDLIYIFLHCNVEKILRNYGKSTKMQDPIIHFYETFLSEYDSAMRKKRWVYYTPQPVVQFIVKWIDHLLKSEFGLSMGLADTSMIEHTFTEQGKKIKKSVHRVQLLDPATGTGTFLNEVITYIHKTYFVNQEGIRSHYVTKDLLPRIRWFEILMASYTMAHLKLGLSLSESGRTGEDRINIYLTNSLEEPHDHIGSLFSQQLAKESEQASKIKKEQPIMVVLGNPPYSWISSNNGKWITDKIEDYKYVDGAHFWERKHRLQDDYVKFIRFAESFIEKNGEGIVAYINNHGFLDNPTFRGMRWHLLSTFDKIYILDLHGNSLKKETAPDGSKDENVFDIQAWVSIQFFVKTGKKKKGQLAEVFHKDLFGLRDDKYKYLSENDLTQVEFSNIPHNKPNYFFVPKNEKWRDEYENFIKVDELLPNNKTWIVTMGDGFAVASDKSTIKNRLLDFMNTPYTEAQLKEKFELGKNYAKRIIENKSKIVIDDKKLVPFAYRPFDTQRTYYDNNILWRWRNETMQHFVKGYNLGLIIPKQVPEKESSGCFLTKNISAHKLFSAYNINTAFPLYLYNDDWTERKPNFNMTLLQPIIDKLGASWIDDGTWMDPSTGSGWQVWPEDVFDYIYAVLHSPTYRETYKEFLKIDFPRIPFTGKLEIFWKLVSKGRELRRLHLLDGVDTGSVGYPVSWTNIVEKVSFLDGVKFVDNPNPSEYWEVKVNETQRFTGVPRVAREFWIGGYQPAQKRLKDRKGRVLSYDDIVHYQKMIVALSETARVMREIDEITFM